MLDLIIFPFHSMRKNQKDGFRNRDGHFIENFAAHPGVSKVLVVNRPTTYAEVLYSKTTWKTKGKLIKERGHARLVQVSDKLYSVDYLSYDILGNLLKSKNWFWKAYANPDFIGFIKECAATLNFGEFSCIHHNVYSSSAAGMLGADIEAFDAFDNWLRFPMFKKLYPALEKGYASFSKKARLWITNSDENKLFFEEQFGADDVRVLKNGVDKDRFSKKLPTPVELQDLKRPIIGFGGTITHIFDHVLFNKIVRDHPDKTFVVLGKILDKEVFKRLPKAENFRFLGNKHYDLYPAYVQSFDLCIVAYHSGNKAHGGDSLKFYEYLASGKNIVSTPGNGVFKAHDNVFITDDHEQFSSNIDVALSSPSVHYEIPEELTWRYKAGCVISWIVEEKKDMKNLLNESC